MELLFPPCFQDYLTMLEQNLVGLTGHLEHSNRRGRGSPMERSAHWFSAISDSEPHHTYLRRASADLARTCEGMEGQLGDSDESLFIQNLQSLTDYIRVAQVGGVAGHVTVFAMLEICLFVC